MDMWCIFIGCELGKSVNELQINFPTHTWKSAVNNHFWHQYWTEIHNTDYEERKKSGHLEPFVIFMVSYDIMSCFWFNQASLICVVFIFQALEFVWMWIETRFPACLVGIKVRMSVFHLFKLNFSLWVRCNWIKLAKCEHIHNTSISHSTLIGYAICECMHMLINLSVVSQNAPKSIDNPSRSPNAAFKVLQKVKKTNIFMVL